MLVQHLQYKKGEADKTGAFVILCTSRHMIEVSGKCAVQPLLSKKGFRIKQHSPDQTHTKQKKKDMPD